MNKKIKYKVHTAFRGPKKGDTVKFRDFAHGMSFIGEADLTNKPPIVFDEQGYAIPLQNVQADVAPAGKKLPDDIQEKLDKIKDTDVLKEAMSFGKRSATGALIGTAVGLAIGFYYQKNLWVSGFLGMAAGGMIGNMISKKTSIKKEESNNN
jgi:hypothetical protein